jgi:hypothetical protein
LIVSVENLKKCAKDERVRARAKEIGLRDLDGHIAHGHSLGLEFSEDDFEALTKEIGLDGKNELSDEELKKAAGGIGTTTLALVALGVAGFASIGLVGGAVAGDL